MPKVSVIVPVYNVKKYLFKCLQSICEQTLDDIEIIVVNDGSTDDSLRIIEKFATIDSRIVVIDQENQGLGYARNSALRVAKGEYVSFIDSDDWIDKTMMEAFYLEAIRTGADLVLGTFYEVTSNERTMNAVPIAPVIWQHKVPFSWRQNPDIFFLPTPVWDKFYKRSLITENEIFFVKETCEDIDFKWKIFTSAKRISTLSEPMYYYRVRSTSLTSGKKVCIDVFRAHNSARDFLKSHGLYDKLKNEFQIREISEVLYLSWKARSALLTDEVIFSDYYNLLRKAINDIDIYYLFPKFSYLSFIYIFLVLHIANHDDPKLYRAVLRAWARIAGQEQDPAIKIGNFVIELSHENAPNRDALASIDNSRDFFQRLQSVHLSKSFYDDDFEQKAAEVGSGWMVFRPPSSARSGKPATVTVQLRVPKGVTTLSFVAWTMQTTRVSSAEVIASIGRPESGEASFEIVKVMEPSTWYTMLTVDLSNVRPNELIELSFQVKASDDLPIHSADVRLSHFLLY